ncbi:MAG: hypothetical protein DRJ43_06335 [Thermoprotei archaeon]|nr:MAG: hypothetical protein DRJ43_06335 [Thermoprotei archaeon]
MRWMLCLRKPSVEAEIIAAMLFLILIPLLAHALSGGAPGYRIVYTTKGEDGFWHLFTINPDGTDKKQKTHWSFHDIALVWAHDCYHILFLSTRAGVTNEIFSLDIKRGTFENLTNSPNILESGFDISPDGRKLVFSAGGKLYILDLSTGARRLISNALGPMDSDFSPRWSPDGRHIAFVRALGGVNFEIFIRDANGGEAVRLTNTPAPAAECCIAFSPDGRRIFFSSNRLRGFYDLFALDLETKKEKRIPVPNPKLSVKVGDVSPEGDEIVFEGFDTERRRNSIYVMNLKSGELRKLDDVWYFSHPRWSPAPLRMGLSLRWMPALWGILKRR